MQLLAKALQDEPLDALVWRITGGGASAAEATLRANPGLADLGELLPENTPVLIPDSDPAPEPVALIQLWD